MQRLTRSQTNKSLTWVGKGNLFGCINVQVIRSKGLSSFSLKCPFSSAHLSSQSSQMSFTGRLFACFQSE